MIPANKYVTDACPAISAILSRIGDKWSVLIVMGLSSGPRRFNEMKRDVAGISQRMLTLTLRGLERDGLVARRVFDTVPPKVEYELAEPGSSQCRRGASNCTALAGVDLHLPLHSGRV